MAITIMLGTRVKGVLNHKGKQVVGPPNKEEERWMISERKCLMFNAGGAASFIRV